LERSVRSLGFVITVIGRRRAISTWIRQFIFYNNVRHPAEMGKKEVTSFLTHLARDRHVSAPTQNQALAALIFLYREVLKTPFSAGSQRLSERLVGRTFR
jgi:hypothetical protein